MLQGFTGAQRRVELSRRIRLISTRDGVTGTNLLQWAVTLARDDVTQGQSQSEVREVHFHLTINSQY
jgi:hypothetical protein